MTILHRATMRIAALALAGVMASSLLSCTQDTREQAFARLPDWRGIWLSDDGIMTRIGLTNDPEGSGPGMFDRILNGLPPYKPGSPYDAAFRALQSANRSNASPPTGIKGCLFYFPGTMEGPRDFEALITPEETALIFAGNEIRHILTDGRTHPAADDIWPTPWGDSIGHWEGDTLVVDTVAVAKDPTPFSPFLSPQAHFSERIRLVGKDRLEDQMTIIDPVALAKPWTVSLPFKRVAGSDRVVQGDCAENDRNPIVDGKMVIAPP
jgi:hypothetical protein